MDFNIKIEDPGIVESINNLAHELADLMIAENMRIRAQTILKDGYERINNSPNFAPSILLHVAGYVEYVMKRVNAAGSNAVVLLEQRLDFSEWLPDGFGTGDVIIITNQVLEIIDLKFGKGIPVHAENNLQLMLYALGSINVFGSKYEFDAVRMTIHQPRLDCISTFEMRVDDLLRWGDEVIKPKVAGGWKWRDDNRCV